MLIQNHWNFGGLAFGGLNRPAQTSKSAAGNLAALARAGSPSMRQYSTQFKAGLARLQKQLDLIPECHIFNGPQSENWATACVRLSTTGTQFDRFDDISMRVDQLATGQLNQGFAMETTSQHFAAGRHGFEIETGDGAVHRFEVTVEAGESNYSVQQKMQAAVNGAGIGVVAEFTANEADGNNTLRFVSAETGAEALSFTVRDAAGSSLIHYSGTGYVTDTPKNAKYTVNGVEYESATNTVDIGNGITAELIGSSLGKDFAIDDGFNEINARNVLSILNKSLNQLTQLAGKMREEHGYGTLELEMQMVLNQYGAAMGDLGIMRDDDGLLNFDFGKLQSAFERGSIRDFYEDYLKNGEGVLGGLHRWAGALAQSPMFRDLPAKLVDESV